jgi:hypothetical protein
MGKCKNVVKSDDYGCQNFEPSSNDPLLCGCCDYHNHYHLKPENQSKFWTMSKETWWQVLWVPKLFGLTRNLQNIFLLFASSDFSFKKNCNCHYCVNWRLFYERGSCRLSLVSSILHTHNCWYSLQWITFLLCTTACHGFHNYFINIGTDFFYVHLLLNDHMIGKGKYVELNYKHSRLSSTNETIQIHHFEFDAIFCIKCSLFLRFPYFGKQTS